MVASVQGAKDPTCAIELAPLVLWLWMMAAADVKCLGPARYPSRHPATSHMTNRPHQLMLVATHAGRLVAGRMCSN